MIVNATQMRHPCIFRAKVNMLSHHASALDAFLVTLTSSAFHMPAAFTMAQSNPSMANMRYLIKPDGSRLRYQMKDVLGMGTDSIVLRRGEHALKVPRMENVDNLSAEEREYAEYNNNLSCQMLEVERIVYQRIGRFDGVADCINISEEGILLAVYERRDLKAFMSKNPDIGLVRKVEWIRTLIQTFRHFHHCKILVYDAALRNIVLTDDVEIKLIDFGQCLVCEPDTDMSLVNNQGQTVKIDLFHLGNLIYSLLQWSEFEFDLQDHEWKFPPRSDLPSTDGLPCGHIIDNCWTGGYASMDDMYLSTHDYLDTLIYGNRWLGSYTLSKLTRYVRSFWFWRSPKFRTFTGYLRTLFVWGP